ncbi:hypothetical protein CDO73_12335 [Saccharibacillus sp. O23]|uniref:hypothetical protein n=1 Tax=Saccharibacillus sp. O23 TaxID=2009338 RepID=UPI000B4E1748|nr:hypothetical protein [Saccharibacillus sp. O23]OWR29865.1 hypothetical protein CDO73_12335 [Saccharibacillus sp. O23]
MNIRWKPNAEFPDPRFYDGISLREYEQLAARRAELLTLTGEAVNDYVNDDELCFDEEEGLFPLRARLSGEAYVGSVAYASGVDPLGFRIMIEVRLTEIGEESADYLGLELTWFARTTEAEFDLWGIDSTAL